jgi:outer membrane protein OmpA-like peptidoglycan-associated protein
MKHLFTLLFFFFVLNAVLAQDTLKHPLKSKDRCLPRFCIDLSYMPGIMNTKLDLLNYKSSYSQAVNSYYTIPKISNALSTTYNLQLSYFFGKERHWGIGTGLMYRNESCSMSMDSLHMEFMMSDIRDTTSKYRQIITSNHKITEQQYSNSYAIPLMLKFKYNFGKNINGVESKNRWGINIEEGLVFTLNTKAHYTSNAAFNYEAIYKLVQQGGKTISVYDNAAIPGSTDWLITKAYLALQNPGANPQHYFDSMYADGYNVKLGATPTNNAGFVSNTNLNLANMLQASLTYRVSYNLNVMLGAYFSYSFVQYNSLSNYRITDVVGTYSSMLNSINNSNNTIVGLNIGLRYYFGEKKDIDDDHVPDSKDDCPLLWGNTANGCPDRDGDGVPDNKDNCPDEPGPASNNGCPEPILKQQNNQSLQPSLFLSQNIINFAYGKSDILPIAYSTLNEVAGILKSNTTLFIFISGYTDNIGGLAANQALAEARAQAVADYLAAKGISKDRMIINGFGKKDFLFDNSTPENRARNRRVEMKFSYK